MHAEILFRYFTNTRFLAYPKPVSCDAGIRLERPAIYIEQNQYSLKSLKYQRAPISIPTFRRSQKTVATLGAYCRRLRRTPEHAIKQPANGLVRITAGFLEALDVDNVVGSRSL